MDKMDISAIHKKNETLVETMKRVYGPNSIFLMSENYHSHCDDDDCVFTYFNNISGEIMVDEWTTRYVCPNYNCYKCKTLSEALKDMSVDIKLLHDTLMTRALSQEFTIDSESFLYHFSRGSYPGLYIPVIVSRGHKWKGDGYLICTEVKHVAFRTTVLYGHVFNPEKGQIEYIPLKNMDVHQDFLEELAAIWKATLTKLWESTPYSESMKISFTLVDAAQAMIEIQKPLQDRINAILKKNKNGKRAKLVNWIKNCDKFKHITDEAELNRIADCIERKHQR